MEPTERFSHISDVKKLRRVLLNALHVTATDDAYAIFELVDSKAMAAAARGVGDLSNLVRAAMKFGNTGGCAASVHRCRISGELGLLILADATNPSQEHLHSLEGYHALHLQEEIPTAIFRWPEYSGSRNAVAAVGCFLRTDQLGTIDDTRSALRELAALVDRGTAKVVVESLRKRPHR